MAAGYPLIVLAGPTASGKSALAVRLAEAVGGEIVSCDSIAVYRLMDIGSAKPSAEERARVQHHCIDILWPNEPCTAGDYARHARAAIHAIRARGNMPIVAGGTGLYLRALIQGLAPAPPRDEALRERLRNTATQRGPGYVHKILRRLDASAAEAIHPNDLPKVIRSIEVTLTAGTPQTRQWTAKRDALAGFDVLELGLAPARPELYERINARAAAMFNRGLVEETAILQSRFGADCAPLGALGYAQAAQVVAAELTLQQAITAAQQGHRNYAKRQMTWFRRTAEMRWLSGFGDAPGVVDEALKLAHAHVASTRRGVISD